MYYMLISNNKQLKYRENGSAWECGIMPRGNMSHLADCSLGAGVHFLDKIKAATPRSLVCTTLNIQKLTK